MPPPPQGGGWATRHFQDLLITVKLHPFFRELVTANFAVIVFQRAGVANNGSVVAGSVVVSCDPVLGSPEGYMVASVFFARPLLVPAVHSHLETRNKKIDIYLESPPSWIAQPRDTGDEVRYL